MLAKFSWLIPKGNKKGKENFCVAHTCSIERASEIRKFSCRSRVKRAKKCTKKRDARAKLFFYKTKPIAFFAVAKTPFDCDPEILVP